MGDPGRKASQLPRTNLVNIVLVNPPNHRYDVDDLAPPLGLLALATQLLLDDKFTVHLVDLNLDSCSGSADGVEDFYHRTCATLEALHPDVVCFTSMGITSHVALEIARLLKQQNTHITTVFGGPHFSSIALDMISRFSWVDFVIAGEGEAALYSLLCELREKSTDKRGVIRGKPATSSHLQLGHPWNSHGLINLKDYFRINSRRVLDFETGRGCKFRCKFCYSPAHWAAIADQTAESIVEDMMEARARGAHHVFFVQDNFLNNTAHARKVCAALAALRIGPSWNCYATLPDLETFPACELAEAGCNSVYVGFDAATTMQRSLLGKGFTQKHLQCDRNVESLIEAGVIPTCAFIIDPFQWEDDELEASFVWASALRRKGAAISLHILTSYHNTPLHDRNGASGSLYPDDFRVRVMFDCPPCVTLNTYVDQHSDLFPFHTRPRVTPDVNRRAILLTLVAQELISRYPFELQDLANSRTTTLVSTFREIAAQLQGSCETLGPPLSLKRTARKILEDILQNSYGFQPVNTERRRSRVA